MYYYCCSLFADLYGYYARYVAEKKMVNRFKKFKIKNGFTLVEIMIVVAIIALLAAIAIPNYTRHMQRARATEAVATMSMVRQAMRDYFINNNTHFNITDLPSTNLGNIDNPLPASVAVGVPRHLL